MSATGGGCCNCVTNPAIIYDLILPDKGADGVAAPTAKMAQI